MVLGYMFDDFSCAAAHVAPLHINKAPSRRQSGVSQHARRPSAQSRRTGSLHSHAHMSPPLTPRGSHEQLPVQNEFETVFHNYLRAFYHFHPSTTVSSSTEESSITVPINSGDVILVHSIHPNGWADGTLLASGARGWLPTNYCNAYDHDAIHHLLTALTHLWDLVRCGEAQELAAFSKQDYVKSIIAGVRQLLDRTKCLNRDTPIVSGHARLRRKRKCVLAELSYFVKIAKKLQSTLQGEFSTDVVFTLLDELIEKAFQLVTTAVRFLDIWLEEFDQPCFAEHFDAVDRPLTPPADSNDSGSTTIRGDEPPVVSHATSEPRVELDDAPDATSATVEPGTAVTTPNVASAPSRWSVASHRASYTAHLTRKENLASERLAAAQDAFLGTIASFIGGHLQSRSSSDLLSTTQQSFEAGRSLLTVVSEIWEKDGRRSEGLQRAKDTMHDTLAELVRAAKSILTPSQSSTGDDVFLPDQGKQLVCAATSCVRAAGDCVSNTRHVIERIGDFESDHTGLGISDAVFEDTRSTAPDNVSIAETQSSAHTTEKPLPPPPQPASPPPPPPTEVKPLPNPPLPPRSDSRNLVLATVVTNSPVANSVRSSRSSIPPLAELPVPHLPPPEFSPTSPVGAEGSGHRVFGRSARVDSVNDTTSSSTYPNSVRDEGASIVSPPSTRATTPDRSPTTTFDGSTLYTSFESSSDLNAAVEDENERVEDEMMGKTYAHELVWNKDGQISGGSLPALIEKLTTQESTPDAMFVTTFYLTFRLFTTPVTFARALVDRFEYVGDSHESGIPVRLRVYNVFKGWLESHWQPDTDAEALEIVLNFATGRLRQTLPAAGKRLAELAGRVINLQSGNGTLHLVSSVGKTSTSLTPFSVTDKETPSPIVSKHQLHVLKNATTGFVPASILDFDPLELARQFTLIESRLFCAIQPEELLASEWTKKTDSKAVNVRAMSTLSTDLANLVADTILQLEEPKKRAAIIKQWVKISAKCLELANYDSLMAIICSLNSSMVLRLKRTWECVSQKTKHRLDELKAITDVSRNHAVLRARLQNHIAPCIPFVGIYLTDLTFIDVGNQTTRQLPPGDGASAGASVINFDKHMRTAKIIGQLQGFQVPYRLAPVPEMQEWMESQIQRVRASEHANVQHYYRRSLALEPRERRPAGKPSPADGGAAGAANTTTTTSSREHAKDKFLGSFYFSSSSASKEKVNG